MTDDTPTFAEESEVAQQRLATYVIQAAVDLKQSKNVELVFQDNGDISRKIDGAVIGTWV